MNEIGEVKDAVSYVQEETKLLVWYDLEEIKNVILGWTEPTKPIYENTKKFYRVLRMPEVGNNGKTIITRNNNQKRYYNHKFISQTDYHNHGTFNNYIGYQKNVKLYNGYINDQTKKNTKSQGRPYYKDTL